MRSSPLLLLAALACAPAKPGDTGEAQNTETTEVGVLFQEQMGPLTPEQEAYMSEVHELLLRFMPRILNTLDRTESANLSTLPDWILMLDNSVLSKEEAYQLTQVFLEEATLTVSVPFEINGEENPNWNMGYWEGQCPFGMMCVPAYDPCDPRINEAAEGCSTTLADADDELRQALLPNIPIIIDSQNFNVTDTSHPDHRWDHECIMVGREGHEIMHHIGFQHEEGIESSTDWELIITIDIVYMVHAVAYNLCLDNYYN